MNIIRDDIKYKNFVEENLPDIPVYFYPTYLDVVCSKNWSSFVVEEGGKSIACFYYEKKKKFFFHVSINPYLTQYSGFWVKSSEKNKYEKLINFLAPIIQKEFFFSSFNLHPTYENHLPWAWAKFKEKIRLTFIIDNNDYSKVYSRYYKATKSSIKYAADKLEIIQITDVNEVIEILSNKIEVNSKIIRELSGLAYSKIFCCIDDNKKIQAAILILEDNRCVYNLINGRLVDSTRGAMALLINHAIEYAMNSKKSFDFEGSLLQGVHDFFESFGGRSVPYHNLYFCKNKVVLALLKMKGKI